MYKCIVLHVIRLAKNTSKKSYADCRSWSNKQLKVWIHTNFQYFKLHHLVMEKRKLQTCCNKHGNLYSLLSCWWTSEFISDSSGSVLLPVLDLSLGFSYIKLEFVFKKFHIFSIFCINKNKEHCWFTRHWLVKHWRKKKCFFFLVWLLFIYLFLKKSKIFGNHKYFSFQLNIANL